MAYSLDSLFAPVILCGVIKLISGFQYWDSLTNLHASEFHLDDTLLPLNSLQLLLEL